MKKLKDILLEGYAWERTPGRPLPTLAEVQAEYQRNEAANPVKAKIAKLEKKIADAKHQYYSDKNLTDEKADQLKKQLGELGRELKRAKREDRTGTEKYGKPSKSGTKPDFLDLDKDGNTEEPMKSAAKDMNESASFQERFADYSDDALRDMIVTLRRFDGTKDDVKELEQELNRRKHDKGHTNESNDDTCPVCGNSPCTCDDESNSEDADMDVLNMSIDEYGDDETHLMDAPRPKNPESDVREKDINESFWNRVKGNLHGHEYILREAFRK